MVLGRGGYGWVSEGRGAYGWVSEGRRAPIRY